MAIVGDAYIVVRALTDKVESDIRRGFTGVEGAGRQAGEKMGDAFNRGFKRNANSKTWFGQFSDGLRTMVPHAEAARKEWAKLTRATFILGPAISQLVGAIFGVVGGLGALVGSAGGAAASLVVIGNGFAAVRLGALAAKLALGGVGKALSALNNSAGSSAVADNTDAIAAAERALAVVIENNRERLVDANNEVRDAQLALNEAFKEGREEIQQLGFEAEDAALAEQQAALDLQKAREVLARVQDLPPNSRVRKEAELAYQEAELNLRKAKDRSADLNKEQDRLARTGVAGTAAVITATQRLAQAEANKAKIVRDSIRDQVNAEEDLAKAKEGTASAGGGADPFAGLNAAQIQFVKNLQSLKPLLTELKASVADAFLPPLWEAISLLADKAFPTIKTGLTQVAGAMGEASKSIAESITQAENLRDLRTIFESSAVLIEGLGRVLGNVWDAAVSVLAAASPLAERFVRFLEVKSDALAKFLDTKQMTGELTQFFNRAGDIMADFGEIFGNIFQGFGKMIGANFGPGSGGDYLIQWLKTATDKFANLDKTAGGQNKLSDYFKDAAVNTQKVMSSIGALLEELIKLGSNQSIGQTFDRLAEGAPIVGRILEKLAEAGPAFADLVVEVVNLIDKFTDTESPKLFFETLTNAAAALNTLLQDKVVMGFVTLVSQIGAVALAFGSIYKTGKFVFDAIIGSLALFSSGIDTSALKVKTLVADLKTLRTTGSLAGTQLGAIGKAIGPALALTMVFSGLAAAVGSVSDRGSIAEKYVTNIGNSLKNIDPKGLNDSFNALSVEAAKLNGVEPVLNNMGNDIQTFATGSYDAQKALSAFTTAASFGLLQSSAGFERMDGYMKAASETLGTTVSTNLAAASAGFRMLAAGTDGSTATVTGLLNKMPELKSALEQVAKDNGLVANEQTLANLAMDKGSAAAQIISAQFATTSAAALDTSGKVQGLADAVRNFGTETSTAIGLDMQYEESLDRLTESVKQNGATLDITSEAGRTNMRALQSMAKASNEAAAAAYEQDGDVAKLTATMEANRTEMENTLVQMGFNKDEAKKYVDQLMMTPESITTKVKTDKIPESKKALEDFYRDSVRDTTSTSTVSANLKRGTGWATSDLYSTWSNSWGGYRNAVGGFYDYLSGSISKVFANGGMVGSGIYAGRPGGLYKFAEPETRWEAFISGKPGQEKRNIEIWKEAGRRLGILANDNFAGNLYGTEIASKMSNGDTINNTSVNITVNPAPGMNESDLAAAVSREISFQMRRGAVA